MSVERRLLNFDDLKSQVRVSSVTLNERKTAARDGLNRRLAMPYHLDQSKKRRSTASTSVAPNTRGAKVRGNFELNTAGKMDGNLDDIRRFRISPPPLDRVSKPNKILFVQTDCDEVNEIKQDDVARRYLTRRDFIVSQPKCSSRDLKQTDAYNMDVAVGVRPKYYQKWARNTRAKSCANDTFNFPSVSLLQKTAKFKRKFKERRNSKRNSGPRKSRLYHLHSSGSLCSNMEDMCAHVVDVDAMPMPRIEISDFTDYEDEGKASSEMSERALSNLAIEENINGVTAFVNNNDKQSTDNNDKQSTDNNDKQSTDSKSISGSEHERTCAEKSSASLETHVSSRDIVKSSADTQGTRPGLTSKHDRPSNSRDDVTCVYNPKLLTVDIGEPEIKHYPNPPGIFNERDAKPKPAKDAYHVSSTSASKRKLDKQQWTAHEVTLSKQLISTEVLVGALNRHPVVETRLESPFRYAKDPLENKPQHYSYYPARPIYNDVQKRREKQVQAARPPDMDYRRCKTDSCIGVISESRTQIKLAKSSPRFSIPDNLIVDFETLRISAHMQKLQKTLSHTPVQPKVFLSEKKVTDSPKDVPVVQNKGFRTVIKGSSVK